MDNAQEPELGFGPKALFAFYRVTFHCIVLAI